MKCVIIMEKDNAFPSGTFDTALVAFQATWWWKGNGKMKKEDRKLENEEGRRENEEGRMKKGEGRGGNPGLSENSMILISLKI